jgi:transcriptional regulator GlxA family with amidase domain
MTALKNGAIDPLIWSRIHYFAKIRKGISYLEDHLSEEVTLADVAAAACHEQTAFSKSFRKRIGISFREFAQTLRIVRSIETMGASDLSLTEIAFSVGFNNLTTFERAFRKCTGLSPSDYRKSLLVSKGIAQ